MQDETASRNLVCEIGRRVWQRGMASANSGNLSLRLDNETVLITPTLVSKGFMKPEQLLVINLAGEVLSGDGYPTTETAMHLRLYQERENIGGVVHGHPPVSTAFAVAGKSLDLHLIPEAVVFLGEIPLVPFNLPGSPELADSIVPYLEEYDAILLENHGVLCWGSDIEQAYHRLETVEFCATVTLTAKLLGGAREIPVEPLRNLLAIRDIMKKGQG
jgi:L-fuculose-phosphate aldolase